MAEYLNDDDWSLRIAGLVIDALVKAKLLPKTDFARAEGIAQEEILVRLIAGDRPEPAKGFELRPTVIACAGRR